MSRDGVYLDSFCLATALNNIDYDAETGLLLYKRPIAKGWSIPPGAAAGTMSKKGYLRVCVGGKVVFAHRLAWAMFFGSAAEGFIDHVDGDRTNNRIANLRVVSKSVNAQNRKGPNSNNSSGFLGATFRPRQGWVAQIGIAGKQKVVGYFATAETAHAAYLNAKRELHEGNTL